jgi:hypothetical protein
MNGIVVLVHASHPFSELWPYSRLPINAVQEFNSGSLLFDEGSEMLECRGTHRVRVTKVQNDSAEKLSWMRVRPVRRNFTQ